jgi:hypothetical protein
MTDERRDDEIIGRALSRAIETIDVNQTPYERSRIATAPARRSIFGMWQVAGGVIAIVLAIAIGTWFTRPTDGQPGVGSSPTVSPAASSSFIAATPSPGVASPGQDRVWVYFARDQLPPVGAFVRGSFVNSSPESRIASRLTALGSAAAVSTGTSEVPAGATTALSLEASRGIAVRVQGDLATVEFNIPGGWGVRGAAQSQALVQQLVYTITEEPGIRRALITETGKPKATIDQLVVDKALTREDVSGYTSAAPDKIEDAGTGGLAEIVDWRASVDEVAAGLSRFVVELKTQSGAQGSATPRFVATLERPTQEKNTDDGKWILRVTLPDAVWNQAPGEAFHCCPLKAVGKTPIRQLAAYPLSADPPTGGAYRGVGFGVTLDDARPWRAFVLQNPLRLVIDIGGDPRATSDRIAVTTPKPGDRVPGGAQFAQTVRLAGAARVFEATVSWRVRDATGKVVATSNFNASLGSSAVWGTFDNSFAVPASVHGNITLEVFEASAKDGSDQGLVRIPLSVP